MGNLFLGFPVNKAKIAEMITGTAAPSAHHTQHENGGSDEINATGLTGAGGAAAFPITYQQFITNYESLTGFDTAVTGTGAITLDLNGITLATGATANSVAQVDKTLSVVSSLRSWAKARQNEITISVDSQISATCQYTMFCNTSTTQRRVGFRIYNGILYGTTANGTSETNLALETLGAGAFTATKTLKAIFTPTVKAEFYVDGVLTGTITTTLPTGALSSSMGAFIYAKNLAVAEQKILIVSHVRQTITE